MTANTDSPRESSGNNPVDGYVCASCGSEFDTSADEEYSTWSAPEQDEHALVVNCTGCCTKGVIVYDAASGGVKRRHEMVRTDRDDDTDADNIWVAAGDNGIVLTDGDSQ